MKRCFLWFVLIMFLSFPYAAAAFTPIDGRLIAACEKGQTKEVERLLSQGANINAKGGDSGTPLFAAVVWNHPEMVRLLLENGAKLDDSDTPSGRTYLIDAAVRGNYEVVKLLLAKRVNVNAKDEDGATALMHASEESGYGHVETVKLLLKAGADINARDQNGETALDKATQHGGGHPEIIRWLKEYSKTK